MSQKSVVAVCVAALGLLLTACNQEREKSPYLEGPPPHYVNSYYGVDVAIPRRLDVCVLGGEVMMSHGFAIPLTRDPHCNAPNPYYLPHISVYFDFGASYDEIPTIDDLAAEECQDALKRIDTPEVRIPGYATGVCRGPFVDRNKGADPAAARGLIEIAVFAWVGGKGGEYLGVRLVTTKRRLLRDTATLKRVLRGVAIDPSKSDVDWRKE